MSDKRTTDSLGNLKAINNLIDQEKPIDALSWFHAAQVKGGRGVELHDRGFTLRKLYDQLESQGLIESHFEIFSDALFHYASNTMWSNDKMVYSPWLENVLHRLCVDLGQAITDKHDDAVKCADILLAAMDRHIGQQPAISEQLEKVIGKAIFYREYKRGFNPEDLEELYRVFTRNPEHAWVMDHVIDGCYENAINGRIESLTSLMSLMCAKNKSWNDDLEQLVYSRGKERGLSMDNGILFHLAQQRPGSNMTFHKDHETLAQAIMSNDIDRKLVSRHIGSREDIEFISRKLNLDVNFCFDKRHYAPSGRVVALYQAFEM